MALDKWTNTGLSTLASGIDASQTTATLATGTGSRFPADSFNVVIWNSTDFANPIDASDREIVRCTSRAGDVLTIVRGQEGTTGVAHNTGGKTYSVALIVSAKFRDDLQAGHEIDGNPKFRSGTSFAGEFDHANSAARVWTLPNISLSVGGVIDRDVVSVEVVSSSTETTVYTFSVPAGLLGTTRALRLSLIGDYLNNTGSNQTLTVRVKYGGTVIGTGAISIGTGTTRRAISSEVLLSAANATNAQVALQRFALGDAGSADGDGGGTLAAVIGEVVHSTMAVDSTAAQTLEVTVQHGAINANLSVKAFIVQVELL